MERKLSWNPRTLQSELLASDESIAKLLVAAKITSLKVDGKDVPAADAPLNTKIEALGSLLNTGNVTQDSAELIAVNGQLAAQVDKVSGELVASQATVTSQLAKITELNNDLTVQKASVASLTADRAQLSNSLDAAVKETSRVVAGANLVNAELSKRCLNFNAIPNLTEADGKTPLATNATQDQKLAALDRVSATEKLTLIDGAVNSAMARLGISTSTLPVATTTGTNRPEMTRKDFENMTPSAQSDFFKRGGKITQ